MPKTITIPENDSGQRLDRWLKKYLRLAPLSLIYRLCRSDIKVSGTKRKIDYKLVTGDEVSINLPDDRIDELMGAEKIRPSHARKSFTVLYEDDHILAVSKPFGLLTHGDQVEKKNTLANQVLGYLLDSGAYDPSASRLFTPSPVNRLDRNTTGIVVFGKDAKAVRDFSWMIAHTGSVDKYYLTLVAGHLKTPLALRDRMSKNERTNTVTVIPGDPPASEAKQSSSSVIASTVSEHSTGSARQSSSSVIASEAKQSSDDSKLRTMITNAIPLRHIKDDIHGSVTLVEVELVTGRPHQIRAHLAYAGYPVVGDTKYGDKKVNDYYAGRFDLSTQFLHAHKLLINEGHETLAYLSGTEIISPLPEKLQSIIK